MNGMAAALSAFVCPCAAQAGPCARRRLAAAPRRISVVAPNENLAAVAEARRRVIGVGTLGLGTYTVVYC